MTVSVGGAVSEGSGVSLGVGVDVDVDVAGGVKVEVAAGVGGWTIEVVVAGAPCCGRQEVRKMTNININNRSRNLPFFMKSSCYSAGTYCMEK